MSSRAHAPSRAILAFGLLTLSACGGHAHALPPLGTQSAPAVDLAAVSFHILVPHRAQTSVAPHYVSPSTQSVSIAIGSAPPVASNITPSSPGCANVSGGTQCTLGLQAPVGNDTFSVSTYDGMNATGNKLSTATVTQAVTAGTSNVVSITLDGIVASILLAVQGTPPPEGAVATVGISVMANDASGNTIVGPGNYVAPIQLTDTDSTGTTALSTQSVASPSTAVTLRYSGGALGSAGANAHITAATSGVAASNITNAYFVTAQDSWLTWGYTAARSSVNTDESVLGASNVGGLKLRWSLQLGGVVTAEPIVVGNVSTANQGPIDMLYVGDAHAGLTAVNAGTGSVLWKKTFQTQYINGNSTDPAQIGCFDQPGGIYGIGGSPVADTARQLVFVVDAMGLLYGLDLASGAQHVGPVQMWPYRTTDNFNVTNDYGALNEDTVHGEIYVPSGAHCGNENFGGVQQYSLGSGSVAHFYTEGLTATQPAYYGGIWGPGGTALDPRESSASSNDNVFVATGDGHTATGQYPCRFVRLNAAMSVVASSPESISSTTCAGDSDFGGSALAFIPSSASGCNSGTMLTAAENKNGQFFLYNADSLGSGPLQVIQLGTADSGGINLGTPIYDPAQNLLFINNASDSSDASTGIMHGLVAMRISGCTLQLAWQRAVGPDLSSDGPPSPPAVANGVVYYADGPGSSCSAVLGSGTCPNPGAADLYAFDETSGAQLFHTTLQGPLFTQPVVVNDHVYVTSWNGYGPGVIYAFGL